MIKFRETIKKIPGARKTYFYFKYGRSDNGFHGDEVMRKFVRGIIHWFNVSSFVETGTYQGDTTEFIAKSNRQLRVYSCECNSQFFASSRRRLKRFGNVLLYNQSSERFLSHLVAERLLGTLPLFYLDAHWYDYWPLPDEISIITGNLEKAIIIVDDCEVPERSDFVFDKGCSLALIESQLAQSKKYNVLFPGYSTGNSHTSCLIGYVTIFQGLTSEFERFIEEPFISDHFRAHSRAEAKDGSASGISV